jgi:Fe-S cluster assembly protein SufB
LTYNSTGSVLNNNLKGKIYKLRQNVLKLDNFPLLFFVGFGIIKFRIMEQDSQDIKKEIKGMTDKAYAYGFSTGIDSDFAPFGLNEDIIKFISSAKQEPAWLLDFRLKAYRHWLKMKEPHWANLSYPPIDYQGICYYAVPKSQNRPKNLDEVDKDILQAYDKLGIPLKEQEVLSGVVAVDAVMDSVSVTTTYKKKLEEQGIIFCSFGEAVQKHPDLVKKYLGSVVPYTDNFFACLNSAVFSDGSFVYIPKGVRCPIELSTYFRINAAMTGQFERTLIVADDDSYVSYLEGCTAPMRDENQLHAAVVEIVVLDRAEVKYSTVQNWYPGDETGKGGIYNFVTKRGLCKGYASHLSWTQVETGSALTWKYPSCVLAGEKSVGEFYSVALTNHYQQADTGTKMIHIGKNSTSSIISKSIASGNSVSTYRGLVKMTATAENSSSFSRCDNLIIGDKAKTYTVPVVDGTGYKAKIGHEATTSKISEKQLFLCRQRGLNEDSAIALIVNGFCKEVMQKLPMEFAIEAGKLVNLSLEGVSSG